MDCGCRLRRLGLWFRWSCPNTARLDRNHPGAVGARTVRFGSRGGWSHRCACTAASCYLIDGVIIVPAGRRRLVAGKCNDMHRRGHVARAAGHTECPAQWSQTCKASSHRHYYQTVLCHSSSIQGHVVRTNLPSDCNLRMPQQPPAVAVALARSHMHKLPVQIHRQGRTPNTQLQRHYS